MDLVESNFDINARHPWELARFSIVSELINKHVVASKNPRILDVGSGDAFVGNRFSEAIKNSTSFCVDIEYTPEIIKKIETSCKNPKLNLYSSLEQVKEASKMDFVTLLDVIEHVPDDVKLMNDITSKPYISTETKFLITVPAFQKLYSSHDDLLKHFRRYDLDMLKKTIADSDMEFVEGGYFFASLMGPRMISVLKEKMIKKDTSELKHLGNWNKGKMVTDFFYNVMMYDYKAGRFLRRLGIPLPGLSLYAICKKK